MMGTLPTGRSAFDMTLVPSFNGYKLEGKVSSLNPFSNQCGDKESVADFSPYPTRMTAMKSCSSTALLRASRDGESKIETAIAVFIKFDEKI